MIAPTPAPGTLVQHLSGGPVMLAYNLNYRADGTVQQVYCRWWDNSRSEFRSEGFLAGELRTKEEVVP